MSKDSVSPEGALVRAISNELGPGKLIGIDDGVATVEYMDSIADGSGHRVDIQLDDLRRYHLWPQTRVFFRDADGAWRSGRVLHTDQDDDYVLIRSGGEDTYLKQRDVYVRWNRRLEDPVEVAVARGFESPFFAERRRPFLRHIHRQRSATRGMPALTSSIVEHHEHQLRVVRTVLQDPVQRYLLADEVGLGKTIEAGLILRQLLLDHPRTGAAIIAPPYLLTQWRSELQSRFLVDDFEDSSISYLRNDAPDTWPSPDALGLVIVDEAHHLAASHGHTDPSLAWRYNALRHLAHGVERLLLLSATPVLNNEHTFLAMLHLLDPVIHDLEDLDAFQARVRSRAELGEIFFTLVESTPSFLLQGKIDALREMFPADGRLASLLDYLEGAMAEETDVARAIRRIRIHISETYRLHRRMLRTRRTAALASSFPLAGRSIPTQHDANRPESLDRPIDDWREAILDQVMENRHGRTQASRLLARLVEAVTADSAAVMSWIKERRDGEDGPPVSDDEADVLETLEEAASRTIGFDVQRIVDLAMEEIASRDRAVIFSSYTDVAKRIHDRLAAELRGSDSDGAFDASPLVARHLATMDPEAARDELARFESKDGECLILVCDRSAEEGRNLQFATRIIHADLPASPNRLEQRIGRVDRFDRQRSREPALAYVLSDGDGASYRDAWFEVLRDGFEVFSTSIATLQYVIDEMLPEVWARVLDDGVRGLREMASTLRERLEQERVEIARQDALDSIEAVEDDVAFAKGLSQEEGRWERFQRATDELLSRDRGVPGNLRFASDTRPDGSTTYQMAGRFDTPDINNMPLIPWSRLLWRFRPVEDRPGVFDRATAVDRTEHVRLFRYGEPFIDEVTEYLLDDDKGRVFALWRPIHDGSVEGDHLFLRFDIRAQGDPQPIVDATRDLFDEAELPAVARRVDEYLPPRVATLWLDRAGLRVTDEATLDNLNRPYVKQLGDHNLDRKRVHVLDELVSRERWAPLLDEGRASALRTAREDLDLKKLCEAAAQRAERLHSARIEQLRIRAERTDLRADRDAVHLEETLLERLLEGVREPEVHIDAVGLYILSDRIPDDAAFRTRQHV